MWCVLEDMFEAVGGTARRKLLREQSQENAPLGKLPAEGSHVNMAVRSMLPENHGSQVIIAARTELGS